MKPTLITALAFISCMMGIAIHENYKTQENKGDTFSFPSDPVDGTECIIVQPKGENRLHQRLVERTIFRYQQGLWKMKETSIMDYDSSETRTNDTNEQ